MTALRRRQPTKVAAPPTAQDTQDLLALAGTLRDRAQYLLTCPEVLRTRARHQLAALRQQHVRDIRTVLPAELDDPGRLGRCRRDPAHTELLATLSMLRRSLDIAAGLRPRIDTLIANLEELLTMSRRAASPVRMFFSPRHCRDTAQVAAEHLQRFVLSLNTLRLADEIRRRRVELDFWQPDALSLWHDYEAHTASYEMLLADLTGRHHE
jgi:hypothetical protein